MKVLFATSECVPFVKTGGLADVVGALPSELCAQGCEARVILPKYGKIAQQYKDEMRYISNIYIKMGWRSQYCGVFDLKIGDVTYYFVDNDAEFYLMQRLYEWLVNPNKELQRIKLDPTELKIETNIGDTLVYPLGRLQSGIENIKKALTIIKRGGKVDFNFLEGNNLEKSWQRDGDTVIYTAEELTNSYNGATMAGTYRAADLLCVYGTAPPSAVSLILECDSISNFLSIIGFSPRIKTSALLLSSNRTSSRVKSSRPAF